MNKHKFPIGNLFGGFNKQEVCILTISIIGIIISYRWNIVISYILLAMIIIYLTLRYITQHRIVSNEHNLNVDTQWHRVTTKEHIFLKEYNRIKFEMYIKSFIITIMLLLAIQMVILIKTTKMSSKVTILMVIYLVISVINLLCLIKRKNVDTSTECSYIDIKKKYSVNINFMGYNITQSYAIIIVDNKKYIYKIDNLEYNRLMIVNYKRLSYVIVSNIFPQ